MGSCELAGSRGACAGGDGGPTYWMRGSLWIPLGVSEIGRLGVVTGSAGGLDASSASLVRCRFGDGAAGAGPEAPGSARVESGGSDDICGSSGGICGKTSAAATASTGAGVFGRRGHANVCLARVGRAAVAWSGGTNMCAKWSSILASVEQSCSKCVASLPLAAARTAWHRACAWSRAAM